MNNEMTNERAIEVINEAKRKNKDNIQYISMIILRNLSIIYTYQTFFLELKGSKISKNLKNNYANDFLLEINDFEIPLCMVSAHLSNFTSEGSNILLEYIEGTKDQLMLLAKNLKEKYDFKSNL